MRLMELAVENETEPLALMVADEPEPAAVTLVGVRRIRPFLLMRPPTHTPRQDQTY